MPVIGYPIIQLLWFLFVYTFDMGWKRAPQGKVLSIQSKFFFKRKRAPGYKR
jgi:hypothetical protein